MSRYLGDQSRALEPGLVARLFSPQVIKESAKYGRSPLLSRLISEIGFAGVSLEEPVSSLFDPAFSFLSKKQHRHEYIYKAAITNKILLGIHSLRTATMLSEFRVGSCRADVVVLNGTSTVYEIKSERDSLKRLSAQVDVYRKAFAAVNVICGANHVREVQASVPSDVGILILTDRYNISTHREATADTSTIDPRVVFDSLQLNESKKILDLLDVEYSDNIPNTKIYHILKEKFLTINPDILHATMVIVLKKTRNQIKLASLINLLPKSLASVLISTPLRTKDHERLLSAMDTPIKYAMEWKKN